MPHVLFIMDPLSSLSLKKDSTLAMIRAAQRRGWRVSYAEQQDLLLLDNQVQAPIRALTLSAAFVESLDPSVTASG